MLDRIGICIGWVGVDWMAVDPSSAREPIGLGLLDAAAG